MHAASAMDAAIELPFESIGSTLNFDLETRDHLHVHHGLLAHEEPSNPNPNLNTK